MPLLPDVPQYVDSTGVGSDVVPGTDPSRLGSTAPLNAPYGTGGQAYNGSPQPPPPLNPAVNTAATLKNAGMYPVPQPNGTMTVLDANGKVIGTIGLDGSYQPSGTAAGGGSGSGEAIAAAQINAQSAQAIAAAAQTGDTARLKMSIDATAANTATTEAGANTRAAADLAQRAHDNGITQEQQAARDKESGYQFDVTTGSGAVKDANSNAIALANTGLNAESEKTRLTQTAAQMAATQAIQNRQAALAERTQEGVVLSRPSDYVSRAFQSRGLSSPTATISHADILNAMRGDAQQQQDAGNAAVQSAQDAASRFVYTPPTMQTYQQPSRLSAGAWAPPPGMTLAGSGGAAPLNAGVWYAGEGSGATPNTGYTEPTSTMPAGSLVTPTGDSGATIAAAARGGVVRGSRLTPLPDGGGAPRFTLPQPQAGAPGSTPPRLPTNGSMPYAAEGGGVSGGQPNMVMTGDPKPGSDKPNEELVIDLPNDGGLMVIPKDRLIGKRTVADASTGPRMMPPMNIDDMTGAPKAASGGLFGADPYQSDPTGGLDSSPVTQDELIGDAKTYAPPAISSTVAGQAPPAYRLAEPNLTPSRLAQYTPSETSALNTYLGVVDNTSLEDEQAGMNSLFGQTAGAVPRARLNMAGAR